MLIKILIAPVLILLATLIARKWGNKVGGWLIAIPLTSAPTAFLLAESEGFEFAKEAAVGMLLGTASQILFVLAYLRFSRFGPYIALISGTCGFALATVVFLQFELEPFKGFILVIVALVASLKFLNHGELVDYIEITRAKWDLLIRMLTATVVVYLITHSSSAIGAHAAGLISPYPILAAILAHFAYLQQGRVAAHLSLFGLLFGLFTPTAFFFLLAALILQIGYWSFLVATLTGVAIQIISGRFLIRK